MASPFKAYDIRGIYPSEVNSAFALDLGKAVGTYLKGKQIIVSRDGRKSGDKLYTTLIKGIISTGTNVITLGRISTPQFYFSLYSGIADGGVIITASHNPKAYNGFKICGPNAKPIFKEDGLPEIEKIMKEQKFLRSDKEGHIVEKTINQKYIDEFSKLSKPLKKKFKILVDNGNGMGILEVKTLKKIFGKKIDFEVMFPEINGDFPNHECNPTVSENLKDLIEEIKGKDFDFGIAFDGDADRVVFVTNDGIIVPSDLITGIIGTYFAKEGDKVGYEVRSSRNVKQMLEEKGIKGLLYPSGHAYIKKEMMKDKARFAGEKSGHYFYQNLHYTDSSLYTIILMLELLNDKKTTLQKISKPLIEKFSNTGEKNYEVLNADSAIRMVKKEFENEAKEIIEIDGVSIYCDNYFFNIRKSNTEPLVRVNIEGNNTDIVKELLERVEKIISRA